MFNISTISSKNGLVFLQKMWVKSQYISLFELFSPLKQSPEQRFQNQNAFEMPEQKSFFPTEIKQELTENIFIKQEVIEPEHNILWFVLESKNFGNKNNHALHSSLNMF